MPEALPQLSCRTLPAFDADKLGKVCAAFARAEGCVMRQAWLAEPEPDFTSAVVRAGWRGNSLLVYAELEDADIFTRATAHNQRMWELGDVLEIFLSPEGSADYVELHVTPNNLRLQLRFPDTATLRRAQTENRFDHLLLPDGVFRSRAWMQPENKKWFAYAEIPAAVVGQASSLSNATGKMPVPQRDANQPLAGMRWRFSFSRYDDIRGRSEPMISSTSPHARPDFHRREEWGTLIFT